jgi:hypothetical protein
MELKTTISQFTRWNIYQRNSGQPYGTIRGSDYIYAIRKPIINQTGSASRMEHTKELVKATT